MFKLALIFLIVTLIISVFSVFNRSRGSSGHAENNNNETGGSRHVSKKTGEYVDYEDMEGKE
jgi:hypothetical protein